MSVYVDNMIPCLRHKDWPYSHACHLVADSVEELHIFARKIELKRTWFQDRPGLPHYDLTEGKRKQAVKRGAIEITAGAVSAEDKKMNLSKKDQKTFETRQERYGTFIQAHENLGLLWTGLLQNHFRIKLPGPIPSHMVLLMMVASKLNRAAAEELFPDEDNYIDAKIYAAMAQKARIQYEKEKSETLAKQMPAKETGKKKSNSNTA